MFEIAAAASLAGLALDAGSKYSSAEGDAAAQEFKAEQAERRAEAGRLNAVQTDVFFREELNTALANIDAIRAASSIDPTSPTTAAIKSEEARISDRARNIKVQSILAQANEDEREAAFRRESAKDIRQGGLWSAGATVLKGAGSAGRRY